MNLAQAIEDNFSELFEGEDLGDTELDFARIKSPNAQILFHGLKVASLNNGLKLGIAHLATPCEHVQSIVPINAYALQKIAICSTPCIPASAFPEDLRHMNFIADLGL